MAKDCVGDDVAALVGGLGDGECCLLENVRFYKGESRPCARVVECMSCES